MTGLFDGLAGVISSTFGAVVIHTPAGGAPVQIQALFRRDPIEILEENGSLTLLNAPTLRVVEPVASTIATGDTVTPQGGAAYRVKNRHDSGSPAADAMVTFQLQEVTA